MIDIAKHDMSSVVLNNLLRNHYYATKVLPYVTPELFSDSTDRIVFDTFLGYVSEFNKTPSPQEIVIDLRKNPQAEHLDPVKLDLILSKSDEQYKQEWLEERTEEFIKNRKLQIAFEETYQRFVDGEDVADSPRTFQNAMGFCFDDSIGHNFIEDADTRYDSYTSNEDHIPFYIKMMDKVTDGGVTNGTVTCFLAGTGVGKSMAMCSFAVNQALNGKKVLYISMEMAEMRIAERIEANIMDMPLNELKRLSKADFTIKQSISINKMKNAGGNIILKQYPTSTAGASKFRNLLIEAKNKKDIDFDIVYIDYINICKPDSVVTENSYFKIKTIAEELRALAIEFNLPIITATQSTKDSTGASVMSLSNVSESHALSATVDIMMAIISLEEWEKLGKILFQQLKNRYGDINSFNKFMLGVIRNKMRFYDLPDDEHNQAILDEENKIIPSTATLQLQTSVMGILKRSEKKVDFSGIKL